MKRGREKGEGGGGGEGREGDEGRRGERGEMKGGWEKGGRREGDEGRRGERGKKEGGKGREVKGGVEEEWREREKRGGEKLHATQLACKMYISQELKQPHLFLCFSEHVHCTHVHALAQRILHINQHSVNVSLSSLESGTYALWYISILVNA